jgi:hypothetical protein
VTALRTGGIAAIRTASPIEVLVAVRALRIQPVSVADDSKPYWAGRSSSCECRLQAKSIAHTGPDRPIPTCERTGSWAVAGIQPALSTVCGKKISGTDQKGTVAEILKINTLDRLFVLQS